jgi:cell division protein FtsN
MGVAPERPTTVASRLPSLVSTAHAATLIEQPVHQPPHARVAAAVPTWGIQVGSFGNERQARDAASNAQRAADSGEARVETFNQHGRTYWRAQVTGLTAPEAQTACGALARHRAPCVVLRPDQRQVASR